MYICNILMFNCSKHITRKTYLGIHDRSNLQLLHLLAVDLDQLRLKD